MNKKPVIVVILILLFHVILYLLGYHVPRSSFYTSLTLYTSLFLGYVIIYNLFENQWISLKRIVVISVITRLVLIGAIPQLSDDYNRFIWDGHLILNQIDPYQYTPVEALEVISDEKLPFFNTLLENLNSPRYYSIYPVTNQAVFAFAAFFGDENLLWNIYVIRLVLIAFEIMAIYGLYLLIRYLHLPSKRILLYILNPLVLIEVTGNLHFEGMMLCFLVFALISILKEKKSVSATLFGLSIAIKLTPLILFPAFMRYLKRRQTIRFTLIALLVVGILFVPLLLMGSIGQFFKSIRLYHGIFEFNASIYYVLRYLGLQIFQNNMIRILSPLLSVLTVYVIVRHFWKSRVNTIQVLLEGIMFSYLIFYLLNTVVHPWYIITAFGISILTTKKYFIVWSYLIFLSYFTYNTAAYSESTLFLFVEYLGLLAAVVYDYRKRVKMVV